MVYCTYADSLFADWRKLSFAIGGNVFLSFIPSSLQVKLEFQCMEICLFDGNILYVLELRGIFEVYNKFNLNLCSRNEWITLTSASTIVRWLLDKGFYAIIPWIALSTV